MGAPTIELGDVDIGGFNPKFFRQNPPAAFLEEWISKQARYNLFLAKHLPQIEITSVNVNAGQEAGVYDIEVGFTNTGYLPTALEQAQLVKIVRPDRVRLEFDNELTHWKNKKVEVVIPEIENKDVELGWTKNGEMQKAVFKIQLTDIDTVDCKVHVLSSRGGHAMRDITIGK